MRVQDLDVSDNFVKDTKYPSIVSYTNEKPLLELSVTAPPPDDEDTIARVRCEVRPIDVNVSLPLAERLMKFFDTQPVNLNALRDMLLEKVASLRQSAQANVESTMKDRKTLGLDVELNWHVGRVIIPCDPTMRRNKTTLMINLGQLKVRSAGKKTEDKFYVDVSNLEILLSETPLLKRFSIENQILLNLQPRLGVDPSTKLSTEISDVCVVISKHTYGDLVHVIDAVVAIVPVPTKEDLERLKRLEVARQKRRNMWRELREKSDASRKRHVMEARERELEDQKGVRIIHHSFTRHSLTLQFSLQVHHTERVLRKYNVDWIEIRSHSLPPLNSDGRQERIRSAKLKSRTIQKIRAGSNSRDPKVRRRSTLQLQSAAAEELSDEALQLLQRNIVADVSVVLASFSVSLENLVTCRFVNLHTSVRRRAFDTKLSATLNGIYIEDHVRSSSSGEKTFLLRGEADKGKERKEAGTFSSLEVDIYEVLSPDYPTARADMIVEYVTSFIHYISSIH